jgi:hypothetical protein
VPWGEGFGIPKEREREEGRREGGRKKENERGREREGGRERDRFEA